MKIRIQSIVIAMALLLTGVPTQALSVSAEELIIEGSDETVYMSETEDETDTETSADTTESAFIVESVKIVDEEAISETCTDSTEGTLESADDPGLTGESDEETDLNDQPSEIATTVAELEVNTEYKAANICTGDQYSFSVSEPGRAFLKVSNCINPTFNAYFSAINSTRTNIAIDNSEESAESNYIVLTSAGRYYFKMFTGNAINSEATFTIVYEPYTAYDGESTYNDTFATATEIETNKRYWGTDNYYYEIDYDYYHFTLDEPSQVSIILENTFTSSTGRAAVLYQSDSSGETALCDESHFDNMRLSAGSYYIRIYSFYRGNWGKKAEYYLTVSTQKQSADTDEIEKNNLSSAANEKSTNITYTGNINLYSYDNLVDYDWYKFTITKKCYLTVVLGKSQFDTGKVSAILYSEDHGVKSEVTNITISTGSSISSEKMFVAAGTYYVKMSGTASWDYTLNLKEEEYIALTKIALPSTKKIEIGSSAYIDPTFTPSNASEQGLTWKSSNTSVVTVDSNGKVTAISPGKATITATSSFSDSNSVKASCTVYVTKPVNLSISSATNTSSGIDLKWSKVSGASGYYVYRKTSSGSYTLIKTITSSSSIGYTDTAIKSKNGTTYTYKVVPYSDYISGTGTGKNITRLTATKISSIKNSSSKKITVKWSKKSSVSGYQIQYSTNSSFSSGNKTKKVSGASKKSYTLSGLTKGKTYYVRIRTYKTVNGKTYYSAWSSKKSIKITK